MNKINGIMRILGLFSILLFISSVNAADGINQTRNQSFSIKIGQIYFSSIDTTFLADTGGGPLSTNIDFSRDLDMEDSQGSFLIEGMYRLTENSRLDLTYYEIERDGARVIDRDITFGDETFTTNSLVNSQFNYKTLILTYSYLFHRHDEIEVGISAGMHVNEAELALSTTTGNINESVRQTAPLPVIGILLNYDLSSKLTLNYQTRVFLLNYDDYRGNLTDSKVTLEYRISDAFSVEGGFNRRGSELEVRDPDTLKKSDNVASGWIANVIWHF